MSLKKETINLLPCKARELYIFKKHIYLLVIGTVLLFLSFGIFYQRQVIKVDEYQANIDKLNTVKEKLQTEISALKKRHGDIETLNKTIADIQNEIDMVNKKNGFINDLQWSDLLKVISANTPMDLWVTKFKGSFIQKNKGYILLQGIARANSDIAKLIALLEKNPRFKQITLKYAKEKYINNHPVQEFELGFEVLYESKDNI